jgi:tetratricopeptide (TPR) repeat protein
MPFYQDLHGFDAGSAPFVGAFILLLAITTALFVVRKRAPALLVAWLFFLVMLAPFMGLTARPHYPLDRHTYLALLGVTTLIGAGVLALARSAGGAGQRGRFFVPLGVLVGAAVLVLAVLTGRQHRVWNNSVALYEHILRLMPEDSPRRWEIVGQYAAALNLDQRSDEAIEQYREAIELNPRNAEAHLALGMVLVGSGRWAEARDAFERATDEAPGNASAHLNLGRAFVQTGEPIRAADCFDRVIDLAPGRPDGYAALADVMMEGSRFGDALEILSRGTGQSAEAPALLRRLAWLRAGCLQAEFRDGAEAVRLAVKLDVRGGGRSPEALDALAAAYAEQGRFEDAIRTAERGISLAKAADLDALAADISVRLEAYRTGQAYRGMPPIATGKPLD